MFYCVELKTQLLSRVVELQTLCEKVVVSWIERVNENTAESMKIFLFYRSGLESP